MTSSGTISWLVKARGFGFIRCAGGHELFFHRSQVQGVAFELLMEGQNTIFKVGLGTKGLQAIDVKPIAEIPTRQVKNKNSPGKEVAPNGTFIAREARENGVGLSQAKWAS